MPRSRPVSSAADASTSAPHGTGGTLGKLRPLTKSDASTDGIIFSGTRQEIVPRALFLDRRLTPLERNAWQIMRMMLNDDGVTAFPTYEQLRPHLASVPCADQASDETVARALTLLRLSRWLSLARHRRDSVTGRIQSNWYVLHDEPLTPYESIQLDPHYLELVCQSLTHASKAVQRVGYYVLQEITEDPLLSGRVLPTRLHELMQRLTDRGWNPTSIPIEESDEATGPHSQPDGNKSAARDRVTPSSDSEEGAVPSSDSEGGPKSLNNVHLGNPKMDSTVRTDLPNNKEVRTVPAASQSSGLKLPEAFHRLRPEQQAGALAALQRLQLDVQQAVLDEWAVRCRTSVVRAPAGYLFGVVQKAIRGEFRVWASARSRAAPGEIVSPIAPENRSAPTAISRERAQQHIAQLRAMLNI